jgi:hypothetical protein
MRIAAQGEIEKYIEPSAILSFVFAAWGVAPGLV